MYFWHFLSGPENSFFVKLLYGKRYFVGYNGIRLLTLALDKKDETRGIKYAVTDSNL